MFFSYLAGVIIFQQYPKNAVLSVMGMLVIILGVICLAYSQIIAEKLDHYLKGGNPLLSANQATGDRESNQDDRRSLTISLSSNAHMTNSSNPTENIAPTKNKVLGAIAGLACGFFGGIGLTRIILMIMKMV